MKVEAKQLPAETQYEHGRRLGLMNVVVLMHELEPEARKGYQEAVAEMSELVELGLVEDEGPRQAA